MPAAVFAAKPLDLTLHEQQQSVSSAKLECRPIWYEQAIYVGPNSVVDAVVHHSAITPPITGPCDVLPQLPFEHLPALH